MLAHLLIEGLETHHDRPLVEASCGGRVPGAPTVSADAGCKEIWTAGRLLADVHRLALSDADLSGCALALPDGYDLLVELIARIATGCPPLLLDPALPEAAQERIAGALGSKRIIRRREPVAARSPFAPAAFPGKVREDEAAYRFLAAGGAPDAPAPEARTHRAVADQVTRLADVREYVAGERVAARFPFHEARGLESVAFVCIRVGATLVF